MRKLRNSILIVLTILTSCCGVKKSIHYFNENKTLTLELYERLISVNKQLPIKGMIIRKADPCASNITLLYKIKDTEYKDLYYSCSGELLSNNPGGSPAIFKEKWFEEFMKKLAGTKYIAIEIIDDDYVFFALSIANSREYSGILCSSNGEKYGPGKKLGEKAWVYTAAVP